METIKTNDRNYEKTIYGNFFINKNIDEYNLYRANREKLKEIKNLKEEIIFLRQEILEIKKQIGNLKNG